MKAIISSILLLLFISFSTDEQTGEIKGNVHEINSSKGITYATISLLQDSTLVAGITSDVDGNFVFKNVKPGKYSIKADCVGYATNQLNNIDVKIGNTTTVDIKLENAVRLNEVIVLGDKVALISRGSPSQQASYDVNGLSSRVAGVTVIGRSQNESKNYNVDGSKVNGCFRFRPVENHEDYDLIYENEYRDVKINPLSTFSIDVDAASYSNIRRYITQGALPPKDAVRIEEMINYFSYNYKQPTDGTPFSIATEISNCPWNSKHRLIKIGLNGKEIATENLPDNNLVFLIDVSGSMEDENKLPLLKKSFSLLVDQLRKQDRVSIVVYAGNAGLVLPSTSGNEKDKILSAIDKLNAGGSTAGGAGILLAYRIAKENFLKEGNNRVILATDGDFNVGVSGDAELTRLIEDKRNEGIFLTVLGFGTGNYKDSKMEKLADKGNGNFAYVDNIMEANKVLVKEMGATLNTIAKDVKLQIEFNPAKVKAYRLIGYENRMLEDRDFNDDKKDAGELGSGSKVTALYEIIPAGSSEKINDIDTLKYQQVKETASNFNDELMTVKFRYKDPNSSKSKLIVHPLIDSQIEIAKTTDDFRFASAVAEFGMLLRDSKFKGSASFGNVLSLARESKGIDHEGYRAEFIRLVENAELLSKGTARVTR